MNVPIPKMLPIDMKDNEQLVSVPLCVANTSCMAIVEYVTFTILFIVLNLFESTPTIVEVLETLLKLDCKLIDFHFLLFLQNL